MSAYLNVVALTGDELDPAMKAFLAPFFAGFLGWLFHLWLSKIRRPRPAEWFASHARWLTATYGILFGAVILSFLALMFSLVLSGPTKGVAIVGVWISLAIVPVCWLWCGIRLMHGWYFLWKGREIGGWV